MGLDLVEIVMQTEETFGLDLPDDECEQVQTVGDLYRLVLRKLQLPYEPASEIECRLPGRSYTRKPPASWTTPDVWITLKQVIVNQRQIYEEDVRESARFQDDLGCD